MRSEADQRIRYLKRALRLAEKGRGQVSPNPLVGAIVVRDGEIVGEGYHARYGGPHAEVVALREAGERAKGSTLYVTLEPCCHHGKTPPCTDAILSAGVQRVVVGAVDPNPLVNGRGLELLRQAGVQVELVQEWEPAVRLNRGYFKWVRSGIPWVTLKAAITLDGKIATTTGRSKWITSEAARRLAHRLRAEHDAVLVGRGTVQADDPALTVRHVRGVDPVRVLLDEDLGVVPDSKAVALASLDRKTVVFTAEDAPDQVARKLQAKGVEVIRVSRLQDGSLDPLAVLRGLGQRGITSVMVEGGARVFTSLLRERLVDEFVFFVAPKIFGDGVSVIGDLGIEDVGDAPLLEFKMVRRIGPDLYLRASPVWH